MIGSEAVNLMKRRLGFRRNLDAECLFELREAQKRAESESRTQPWFLIQENATITTVAQTATVDLPEDFIKEPDDITSQIRYNPIYGNSLVGVRFLTKVDATDAIPYYTKSDGDLIVGGPRSYILGKTQLNFFPTPDAAYTLYWNYHAKDDIIQLDTENEWLKHAPDYLIGDAGVRLAGDIRNQNAISLFTAMFNEGQKQIIAGNVEREWAGRELRMGSK